MQRRNVRCRSVERTAHTSPTQRKLRDLTSTAAEIAGPNTLGAFDDGKVETDQMRGDARRPLLHQVDGLQQVSLVIWHETETSDDNLSAGAGTGAHVTDVQRDLTSGRVLADFVVLRQPKNGSPDASVGG